MGKMNATEKGMARTYISIIILLAYFSINVGSTAGSVLCINSDGHVLLKLSSCDPCYSPDLYHASKSINDNRNNGGEFFPEDSCCPCIDIPLSSLISQFCFRVTDNIQASLESAANTPWFFSNPKTAERDFRKFLKVACKTQISIHLKSTVLLN